MFTDMAFRVYFKTWTNQDIEYKNHGNSLSKFLADMLWYKTRTLRPGVDDILKGKIYLAIW